MEMDGGMDGDQWMSEWKNGDGWMETNLLMEMGGWIGKWMDE